MIFYIVIENMRNRIDIHHKLLKMLLETFPKSKVRTDLSRMKIRYKYFDIIFLPTDSDVLKGSRPDYVYSDSHKVMEYFENRPGVKLLDYYTDVIDAIKEQIGSAK